MESVKGMSKAWGGDHGPKAGARARAVALFEEDFGLVDVSVPLVVVVSAPVPTVDPER